MRNLLRITNCLSNLHFSPSFAFTQQTINNYYEVLDVERSSSFQEIKQMYLNKSKIYHPDKSSTSNQSANEQKFHQIQEAYKILMNPIHRKRYDLSIGIKKSSWESKSDEQNIKDLDNQAFQNILNAKQSNVQHLSIQQKLMIKYETELSEFGWKKIVKISWLPLTLISMIWLLVTIVEVGLIHHKGSVEYKGEIISTDKKLRVVPMNIR